MRYLDPKNDLTFKKVFCEHPDLLVSLLNALLPLQKDTQIKEVEYLPYDLVSTVQGMKDSFIDVRCTDNNDKKFIVEIQMIWTESFQSKVLFNASQACVKQMHRGRKYDNLQPVYSLCFVNEEYTNYKDKFYHHFSIIDTQDSEQRLDGLDFVFIELPKFDPAKANDKGMMTMWLRYLTEIDDHTELIPQELTKSKSVNEAIELLKEPVYSLEELDIYDKYWDFVSKERTILKERSIIAEEQGLKKGFEKGIKKGIEKGLEKGMEKGLQQGIEKGMQQGAQSKTEAIVINLFEQSLPLNVIAKATELSEAKIKDILEKNGKDILKQIVNDLESQS